MPGQDAVTCMRERLAAPDRTIGQRGLIQKKENEQEKCHCYVLALFDRTLTYLDTGKNRVRR